VAREAEALVLTAPRHFERRTIALPAVAAGDAIVRVEACGLCGTDHEQWSGALRMPEAFIPGHEIVGTIEEISAEARAARGLEVGDRVAVEVFQACGECEPCRSGAGTLCHRHGLADSYGIAPLRLAPGLWGGYASHIYLPRDAVVHRVPAALDPVRATLFNPLGAGIRWATMLPTIRPGAVVAVLGPGLRGLCSVVALRAAGAGFLLLTGAGAADRRRLELGRELGADLAVDVTHEDPVARLKAAVRGLADVVIDVTAAAPAAFLQALDLVRPGGTVVLAGMRGEAVLERFNPDRIALKEITLIGARGVSGEAYRRALELLARDQRFAALPRRVARLEPQRVGELLDEMAQGAERPLHAVVVPGAP
jgi:alcohol dehydrogenase